MDWLRPGLVFLALALTAASSTISPDCRQKVAQVLCSIHHPDQLLLCLNGVTETAVFRNDAIASYCFTLDPDHGVTQKLCDVKTSTTTTSTTTTTTTTRQPQLQVGKTELNTFSHVQLTPDSNRAINFTLRNRFFSDSQSEIEPQKFQPMKDG